MNTNAVEYWAFFIPLFGWFSSNSLAFCERKSERAIRAWKRANRSCRSFVMNNLSKELTVTLLYWATWANRSQSLFCKEGHELNCSSRSLKKSKWAKSDGSDSLLGIQIRIVWANRSFFNFWQAIHSNQKRIIHIALFEKAMRAISSFVNSDIIESLTVTL